MSERKITTEYVYPPVPVRCWDWSACFEGYEEDGPYGRGATEAEAVADLLRREAESCEE